MPCRVRLSLISYRNSTTKLCHFILDIVDYSLAGKDQQQTNWPNNQAGA